MAYSYVSIDNLKQLLEQTVTHVGLKHSYLSYSESVRPWKKTSNVAPKNLSSEHHYAFRRNNSPDTFFTDTSCVYPCNSTPKLYIAINPNPIMSPNLRNCPSVFIGVDRVRLPLPPPYAGPFCVLECQDKYFITDINDFSIDKLKMAYLVD